MIDREEYIRKYKSQAKNVLEHEELPMVSEILDYTNNGKVSKNLQHVFDFFDDKEEFTDLVTRKNLSFSEQESSEFIDTVIAANITDISRSGLIYKMLMACGDNLRILGDKDCGSKGRELTLPIDEETFNYEVRNSYVDLGEIEEMVLAMLQTGDKVGNGLLMFDSYQDFIDTINLCELKDGDTIHVRTPMTCVHHLRRGCCPVCAGKLPEKTQNIGAFATLMITEVATQNALSSMNKGTKVNVNNLLTKSAKDVKTINDYYEWAENILGQLKGDKVQRRFFEIALLGRLFVDKKSKKIRVSSLSSPNSSNYFGEFIYRPNRSNYAKLIRQGTFMDDSLKAQIAINEYAKSIFRGL